MTKKTIRDALTGNEIEVVVSSAGTLYHIEGFSHAFITSVTLADLAPYRPDGQENRQKATIHLQHKGSK